ncbi:putative mfs transporter [Phaeomoniella chlamydospora]|uniref:Putative mfs transporter n=1 Tax=Phaeomoniella chlamydospora TaxID=158046 RepID=A0A0G2H8R1_PHACM|nr:putative mfs transporter [Phaeomoniella chlamydospora]
MGGIEVKSIFVDGSVARTPSQMDEKSEPLQRCQNGRKSNTGDEETESPDRPSEQSNGTLPPPTTAVPILQRWNNPRINMWRCFATFYSFIILGTNDSAYGALIPYLETYYDVNYTVISLVFLSPMGGYIVSALLLNKLHMRFGQRGIAFAGSLAHLIAYTAISLHPPYPVLIVSFIVAGYGNGVFDGAWNAWIGDMANCNEVLGILHAFYGVGGVLAPFVATTVITKSNWAWYEFYYIMIGAAVLEIILLVTTFWTATGEIYRNQHSQSHISANTSSIPSPNTTPPASPPTTGAPESKLSSIPLPHFLQPLVSPSPSSPLLLALRSRITWLAALYLLIYVGIEVSTGGWTVTFMLRIRHASSFPAGMTSTGFWLGVTIGRLILGFVTSRIFPTEKHAIATYTVFTIALVLVYWLIPHFIVSAVAVSLVGFFIGPMFPAAVVVATKLLPKHLHVGAIGFAAAMGASGACALPFAVGAVAQKAGVWVLMPIVLGMLVLDLGVWLLIPRLPKRRLE